MLGPSEWADLSSMDSGRGQTLVFCVSPDSSLPCGQSSREDTDKLLSQVISLGFQNQWCLGKTTMPQLSVAPMSPLRLLLQVTQHNLNLGLT